MTEKINPGHAGTRAALRVIGPLVLIAGLIFAVIGIASFFAAFGSSSPPRHFWCAFIGLPLVAIGIGISKFAFLGAVTRYVAGEIAPVGKDVVNYMAGETKEAVAGVVGRGLSSLRDGGKPGMIRCHKCNEINEVSARFCKNCGASLGKSVTCPKCGELNDPDARFCDNCGGALS